jgi:hypothetical protein
VQRRNLVWTFAAAPLGPAHLDLARVVPEQEAHECQPAAGSVELKALGLHELRQRDGRPATVILEQFVDPLDRPRCCARRA